MTADEVRAEGAHAWLQKAPLDLQAGAHDLSAESAALWPDAAFHAQQAAEKPLKAFLAWHDVPFRKTHNSEELGRACVEMDPTLATIVDRAAPLTEYAWKFRYPGEPDVLSRAEANQVLEVAHEVYEAVAHRLPLDVQV